MAALAGFLVVFELLAYQLRSGHDPAIGSGPLTAQVSSSAAGTQRAPGSSRAVVTRASGGSAGVAQTAPVPATGARPQQQASHAVTTRSSGGGSLGTSSAHGNDRYEQEGEL
jgi:hypothetical protein